MSDEPAGIQPPRRLRGRRIRRYWRQLAPQVAEAGKLSITTEPLLTRLCVILARWDEYPNEIFNDDTAQVERLAKSLGLR